MTTRPVNEGLEGLVKHRGAPTCVETHVKTSIESVQAPYRLHLTAWRHAEPLHGDRSSALCTCGQNKGITPVGHHLVLGAGGLSECSDT